MPSNPLDGLWQAAAQAALRAELACAAAVDKHTAGPFVMSALAGIMVGMGTDAVTLLLYELPPYLPDLLLGLFGAWDTTPWELLMLAAAVPVTAWALRAWWVASMQVLQGARGPLQVLRRQWQQQWQRLAASGSSDSAAEQQQEQEQKQQDTTGSSSHWLAAGVIAFRGLCLGTVASSLAGLMSNSSISSITGSNGMVTGAVLALAAAAAAAAAAGLLLLREPAAASSSSSSGPAQQQQQQQPQLLLPLLGAEAAWAVAMAGLHPLANAAAAAVLAACLVQLHRGAVAPRLQQFRVAAGDAVQVHVSLSLAGTRPVFDSTLAEEPLALTAAPLPPDFARAWERAGSDELLETSGGGGSAGDAPEQQQQQEQQQAGGEAGAGAPTLQEVQRELQGWLARPAARWDALAPFAADAAQGLYLGESRAVRLFNPRVLGYFNASFQWWQPLDDVAAKFGGQVPNVGDVMWFPVTDGAALLTRVNAVGEDFVELDANYGVTDAALELRVQLVRLGKQAQQ